MRRLAMWTIGPVAMIVAPVASAQDGTIRALVERFETARTQYDPVALSKTLASDYEEISPVGTVDSREAVLGFYAPDKKRPVPAMTDDDITIRTVGNIAVVTLRKSFTPPGSPARSIRVRYVAQGTRGTWRLISAQYTPIPAAKAR